jgi:GcrA cell cycle regulator
MIGAHATWTTKRIELLKNRIMAGLSCSEIAREIGLSRNAVIGKANRLGLSRFNATGQQPQSTEITRHKKLTRRQIAHVPCAEAKRACADAQGDRCSLSDLQEWNCRWPIGDPGNADFGFCGKNSVDGLPYCAAHVRLAYRLPGKPRSPFSSRKLSEENPPHQTRHLS